MYLEHMASQMEVFHFCRPLHVAVWKVVHQCLGAPGEICPRDVRSSAQGSGFFFFFSIKNGQVVMQKNTDACGF